MARRLAVLGKPVAHSLSPAIHTAAFEALGIADEWSYEAIEVDADEFDALVRDLAGSGFAGVNVTIPHKRAALAIASERSEAAREIGAANMLSFDGNSIRADNTDAQGLLSSLPRPPDGLATLVLGAGGAARAAIWGLRGAGAKVSVWNRTQRRAAELAAEFGVDAAGEEGARGADFELIVNATSVGLEPGSPSAGLKALKLDADSFVEQQIVVDLVYGAGETELISSASARGATAVDGREVLVRQGAASFRIWTGLEPSLPAMRAAAMPR